MPPQQPDRLLDLFNKAFDFGAHGFSIRGVRPPLNYYDGCSDGRRKAQSASHRPPAIKASRLGSWPEKSSGQGVVVKGSRRHLPALKKRPTSLGYAILRQPSDRHQ
jgi:hypothetical protein